MELWQLLLLATLISSHVGGRSPDQFERRARFTKGRGHLSSDESLEDLRQQRDQSRAPFSVVTGPINDDDNDEFVTGFRPRDGGEWPLMHHIDFDERFPGEDQIAEESSLNRNMHRVPFPNGQGDDSDSESVEDQHRQDVFRRFPLPPPPPFPNVPTPQFNDDLVVPDFARMFAEGPQIGGQTINMQPWWQLMNTKPQDHWWKGSNVCIKREEDEESSISDDLISTTSTTISGQTATQTAQFNPRNVSSGSSPEFQLQFSACEDKDLSYSCITKLYGPEVIKTIKTEYECCSGYSLDSDKTTCKRGKFENLAKTIESLGARRFSQLVKNVGLEAKLERENLTIFVPKDEALAGVLSVDVIEQNSINNIPDDNSVLEREAVRRRRSILSHSRNEAGGREVRRRPHAYDNHHFHNRHHRQELQYPERVLREEREDTTENLDNLGNLDHLGQLPHVDFNLGDIGIEEYADPDPDSDSDWRQNALNTQDRLREKKLVSYGHDDNNALLQKTLLSHMIQGKLSTDDFVDEKVVYTENNNSVLRLNTWNVGNEKVKTVNCARLVSVNHRCTNGLVHLIDKMVTPVSLNIFEVVEKNPELSVWKNLLTSSGLSTLLQDTNQHLTLLAPTNAALDKLGHSMLFKLRSGDSCLKRIVRHHILPITFCTSIVYGKGQVRTVDHDLLDVERTSDDKLYINGTQVIIRDIVTTNGVVHVIDAVLLSENDKPVSNSLTKEGLTTFLNYAERCGIRQMLDEMTNITIFAPTNSAFEELPQEFLQDTQRLREVLLYHVATPEIRACHFSHQQLLPTSLESRSIRINLYSSFPLVSDVEMTAQCGKVTRRNSVACNGVVHSVDRILLPPDLDLANMLKTQQDFSIFSRLLSENEALFNQLKEKDQFHTLFVPTDKAFYSLSKGKLEKILNDKNEAIRVLKRHITSDSLCCAGIAPNLYFMTKRVATLGDVNVPVYRDPEGQVVFGSAKVTTCDLTASNGIIHSVDSVLVEDGAVSRSEQMGALLPETLDQFDIRAFFIRL